MRLAVLIASTLALGLTACATPEARVRTGLVNAGLSRPVSACMAERMVDRLSLLQLRRLGRLGDLREGGVGELTMEQFLRRTRALGDPEIVTVTTASAAICAVRAR